jgi:hypothetical protein
MKTRKALAILAACIGFVAAIEDPAHSADGLYAKVGAWEVRGNSQSGTCYTFANYPDGVSLTIFFTRQGVSSLAVHGVNVIKGQQFAVDMAASNGNYGTVPGYSIANGTVVFDDINLTTISTLANARQLFIRGLGTYNLAKSKAALLKTLECVKALSGEAV